MMRAARIFGIAVLTLGLTQFATPVSAFEVSSPGISGGKIDGVHACKKKGGKNLSPELVLADVPAGTKYLAIVMDDPDAMAPAGKVWVHWNVVNIPVGPTTFAAGEVPAGEELSNSSQRAYYGMCPPDGRHTYRIAVFALKDKIDTSGFFGPSELTIEDFEDEYGDLIVGKAVTTGDYG